jgi:glycine betaine/proline transport system ATP-binding protein
MFQVLAETSYPVAVVDEAGRLKGVVIKGSLLAGLAETAQAGETS